MVSSGSVLMRVRFPAATCHARHYDGCSAQHDGCSAQQYRGRDRATRFGRISNHTTDVAGARLAFGRRTHGPRAAELAMKPHLRIAAGGSLISSSASQRIVATTLV